VLVRVTKLKRAKLVHVEWAFDSGASLRLQTSVRSPRRLAFVDSKTRGLTLNDTTSLSVLPAPQRALGLTTYLMSYRPECEGEEDIKSCSVIVRRFGLFICRHPSRRSA
jgi:hypothetical protein